MTMTRARATHELRIVLQGLCGDDWRSLLHKQLLLGGYRH